MDWAVYNPHPDIRPVGFKIQEVFHDMFIRVDGCRVHYVRLDDADPWQSCPLGDNCPGIGRCCAEDVL